MSRQLTAHSLPLIALLLAAPCFGDTPDGGANVAVVVEPDGSTMVDVRRGQLKVKSGGAETRIGAGESVRAQKGKPVKRILRAVAPATPAEGATLNNTEVPMSWQKVPGAARYVVEVSPSPELSVARTQTVDGTKAVVHLDAGTWYWRVVALDGGGATGKRAPARRLTIDTTPPKLKTGKPEWK